MQEYDRAATEKVDRMFRRLNRALFQGRESGFSQTDRECREWSSTFPHLQLVEMERGGIKDSVSLSV